MWEDGTTRTIGGPRAGYRWVTPTMFWNLHCHTSLNSLRGYESKRFDPESWTAKGTAKMMGLQKCFFFFQGRLNSINIEKRKGSFLECQNSQNNKGSFFKIKGHLKGWFFHVSNPDSKQGNLSGWFLTQDVVKSHFNLGFLVGLKTGDVIILVFINQHAGGGRSPRSPLYPSCVLPRHPSQQHFLGCNCSRMASVLQDFTYDTPRKWREWHLRETSTTWKFLMNEYSWWSIKGISFQRWIFWVSIQGRHDSSRGSDLVEPCTLVHSVWPRCNHR